MRPVTPQMLETFQSMELCLSANGERLHGADLDEIAWAIAPETGSPVIAERLIDLIATCFNLLADHPKVGHARDDLRAGARSFPVGNYVIDQPDAKSGGGFTAGVSQGHSIAIPRA